MLVNEGRAVPGFRRWATAPGVRLRQHAAYRANWGNRVIDVHRNGTRLHPHREQRVLNEGMRAYAIDLGGRLAEYGDPCVDVLLYGWHLSGTDTC